MKPKKSEQNVLVTKALSIFVSVFFFSFLFSSPAFVWADSPRTATSQNAQGELVPVVVVDVKKGAKTAKEAEQKFSPQGLSREDSQEKAEREKDREDDVLLKPISRYYEPDPVLPFYEFDWFAGRAFRDGRESEEREPWTESLIGKKKDRLEALLEEMDTRNGEYKEAHDIGEEDWGDGDWDEDWEDVEDMLAVVGETFVDDEGEGLEEILVEGMESTDSDVDEDLSWYSMPVMDLGIPMTLSFMENEHDELVTNLYEVGGAWEEQAADDREDIESGQKKELTPTRETTESETLMKDTGVSSEPVSLKEISTATSAEAIITEPMAMADEILRAATPFMMMPLPSFLGFDMGAHLFGSLVEEQVEDESQEVVSEVVTTGSAVVEPTEDDSQSLRADEDLSSRTPAVEALSIPEVPVSTLSPVSETAEQVSVSAAPIAAQAEEIAPAVASEQVAEAVAEAVTEVVTATELRRAEQAAVVEAVVDAAVEAVAKAEAIEAEPVVAAAEPEPRETFGGIGPDVVEPDKGPGSDIIRVIEPEVDEAPIEAAVAAAVAEVVAATELRRAEQAAVVEAVVDAAVEAVAKAEAIEAVPVVAAAEPGLGETFGGIGPSTGEPDKESGSDIIRVTEPEVSEVQIAATVTEAVTEVVAETELPRAEQTAVVEAVVEAAVGAAVEAVVEAKTIEAAPMLETKPAEVAAPASEPVVEAKGDEVQQVVEAVTAAVTEVVEPVVALSESEKAEVVEAAVEATVKVVEEAAAIGAVPVVAAETSAQTSPSSLAYVEPDSPPDIVDLLGGQQVPSRNASASPSDSTVAFGGIGTDSTGSGDTGTDIIMVTERQAEKIAEAVKESVTEVVESAPLPQEKKEDVIEAAVEATVAAVAPPARTIPPVEIQEEIVEIPQPSPLAETADKAAPEVMERMTLLEAKKDVVVDAAPAEDSVTTLAEAAEKAMSEMAAKTSEMAPKIELPPSKTPAEVVSQMTLAPKLLSEPVQQLPQPDQGIAKATEKKEAIMPKLALETPVPKKADILPAPYKAEYKHIVEDIARFFRPVVAAPRAAAPRSSSLPSLSFSTATATRSILDENFHWSRYLTSSTPSRYYFGSEYSRASYAMRSSSDDDDRRKRRRLFGAEFI